MARGSHTGAERADTSHELTIAFGELTGVEIVRGDARPLKRSSECEHDRTTSQCWRVREPITVLARCRHVRARTPRNEVHGRLLLRTPIVRPAGRSVCVPCVLNC